MDERAFQDAYRATNPLACPFEKAILICRCSCREAQRVNIAERDTVNCRDAQAQGDCSLLVGMLRQNAAFALKLTHADAVLPHAKYVKVQCGGLLGLQAVLQPEQAGEARVEDIRGLVLEAQERFSDLQELPYSEIVRGIAGFEFRRRPVPK
ncbi:MAG: hypothetical protein ACYCY5_01685 [Sulfuricella sp.]